MARGPLDGFRIIDLTQMVSGPVATMLLGDQGADVIKIEAPGVGDLVRELGPKRGGISASFATSNRNKRSVVIDLKSGAGRELLAKLIKGADVFVQNFRPGAAERMGVGEEAMRVVATANGNATEVRSPETASLPKTAMSLLTFASRARASCPPPIRRCSANR